MNSSVPSQKRFLWIVLYVVMAIIDAIQIIIDLTGVGIAISEAAEPFIGIGLLGILQVFGVSIITHPRRLGSVLASFGLGAFTGGAAPFWVIDVWYIHRDYKREIAAAQNAQAADSDAAEMIRQPLNQNGRRNPEGSSVRNNPARSANLRPLNVDGVRAPSA